MKKAIVTSALMLGSIICLLAQTTASAVVFSQDGEKFWVIVNGVKQNATAQTNVKITGLNMPSYKFKIIFEDDKIPAIDQNVMTQDVDGKPNDVTYVIKKNNKGNYVMRVNSFQPASGNTAAEPNQTAVPFSTTEKTTTQPAPATQQTTTTTQQTNVGMNTGGVGVNTTVTETKSGENVQMNINMSGMGLGTGVTTTTTTTQNTTPANPPANNTAPPPPPPAEQGCNQAASAADFASGKKSVSSQSFTETQLKTAKTFTKNNCLSVLQIKEVMGIFGFDETKLDYAKYAYDYCVDKKNYYKLSEAFSFSGSTDELNNFLEGK